MHAKHKSLHRKHSDQCLAHSKCKWSVTCYCYYYLPPWMLCSHYDYTFYYYWSTSCITLGQHSHNCFICKMVLQSLPSCFLPAFPSTNAEPRKQNHQYKSILLSTNMAPCDRLYRPDGTSERRGQSVLGLVPQRVAQHVQAAQRDSWPSTVPGESSWADALWHWVRPQGTGTLPAPALWPSSSLAEGNSKEHFYTSRNGIVNPPTSFTHIDISRSSLHSSCFRFLAKTFENYFLLFLQNSHLQSARNKNIKVAHKHV